MDQVCALHGRRQCCLANPQFLEYIASFSASEPALVSSGSSTSDSSTTTTTATAVDPSSAEAPPPPKKSGQLSPRPASITPTSILIKARKNMDVPNPQPVSRRHSSPTAVSEPLRSPPSSPPPLPTSTPNTTRSMTDSAATTPIARRRTLDFASGDENSARRDSRAVNALPKPTKPIYPRPKITKFAVESDTPSSSIASSPRSRVIAASNHVQKVTVTPPSKSSTPSARSPPSKGGVKFQTTKPIASKTTMPTPAKLPNPTNHVHLSRKTDTIPISFFTKLFSSKATYKKRQSDISDIRDVFVIDPALVLPRGMFRALDDSFVGLGRKDSFDDEVLVREEHQLHHHGLALKRSRTFSGSDFRKKNGNTTPTATPTTDKKNLKLEVENGGIDVDVHLVESLNHSTKRTTIDLRLLPDENFKSGNHSLIARIHAPEKRAPFHLTARTYVLPPPPPPPPPPLANEPTPSTQKTNSSVLKHHRRSASNPTSHNTNTNHTHPASLSTISLSSPSYNTPLPSYFSSSSSSSSPASSSSKNPSMALDKSNMEIQIPRSYRGPITIHVASGNLDEHIWVSREVRERSVVLREGRFARGCFVGRQEFDDEEEEEENEGDDGGGEEGEGEEEGGGDGEGEGGMCGICGGSRGEGEERKEVVDGLRKDDPSTTPLRIVKRKPIKSFSMQNLEKDSSSALKGSPEPQSPPPPPPPTSTTIDNNFSPTPTPTDILTTRPSFLDTDPNLSPNHNSTKLSRNQDLNGRARRVEYRSSPLRFSMMSVSAPHLPVLVEEGDMVAVVREGEGEDGEGGVVRGGKVVRVEEMSSLPSSEEEEEDGDGDGDGAGTASGSVNYESAESGGSASVEELSEKTDSTIQPQPPPPPPQPQQIQPQRCTCIHHQPQKKVQQRQGGRGGMTISRKKRREWVGDRIDIMIGKGMVRIRYDDEVEEGSKSGGRGGYGGKGKGRGRGGGRWFGR